jgi:hypothetical protein
MGKNVPYEMAKEYLLQNLDRLGLAYLKHSAHKSTKVNTSIFNIKKKKECYGSDLP